MNIKGAKDQVKYSVISYLSKDEFGDYRIPIERQRPLFLMGPPGIGKTDIMAQVAEEMDIALVAYSMTHHTRQSALGLPFIQNKEYAGKEFRTTEYTMSEIIASVYDTMEATGKHEGILFLDEINCISETLAPSMLQFLQFKTFGRHKVPEGWVVITAGNPPEYNDSVREFDLATMDRLKRIDIEPDLGVWQKYAQNEGVHSAILSYLEIKKDDFYSVRTTVDGKSFVTARGWVDLSEMIVLYEQNGMPVDVDLIRQYIHDERIARDFAAYYELFFRYRKEYDIAAILEGRAAGAVVDRAGEAPFDKRITIIRLIDDALESDFRRICEEEAVMNAVFDEIKGRRGTLPGMALEDAALLFDDIREERNEDFRKEKAAHHVSRSEGRTIRGIDAFLSEIAERLKREATFEDRKTDDIIRKCMAERNDLRRTLAASVTDRLDNAFGFIEKAYGEDNEMLIFVTTLTEDRYSADFISRYGCEAYFRHNKGLLLYEREQGLMDEIGKLEE